MSTGKYKFKPFCYGGKAFSMYLSRMTLKQRLLKWANPVYQWITSVFGSRGQIRANNGNSAAPVPFYGLSTVLNNADSLLFTALRNKKVLLVNTASDCVYTSQYKELQHLAEQYADRLIVIAFPSNDFGNQEPGTDGQIAAFCDRNYHVCFPISRKATVKKGKTQHDVYQWLTDKSKNGWNDHAPDWNFAKYLVNEQGQLTHYIGPAVSPKRIKKLLR